MGEGILFPDGGAVYGRNRAAATESGAVPTPVDVEGCGDRVGVDPVPTLLGEVLARLGGDEDPAPTFKGIVG